MARFVFCRIFTVLTLILFGFNAPAANADEVKIKHGGLTLNGQLDLADGKTLAQGVVLMIHGTLAHNEMDTLKNLREVLNGRGMNTLAVNLSLAVDDRRGMYDCKIPHRHKHTDAVDEISLWFDWLKSQNAGPVILFGHSRGGNQAARFAAGRGHPLLDKLVLLAPATYDAGKAATGFESQHKQPLAGALAKATKLAKAGRGSEIMPKVGVLYCPEADVTADSFVSYYGPDPDRDTPSILGKVKVPVLVVAGSADTVLPDLPAKMKGKTDGERIQFNMIDGATHFFLDLFAEDVADHMEAFATGGS